MDWDQIESRWNAMARRVRADLPPACTTASQTAMRRALPLGATRPIVAGRAEGAGRALEAEFAGERDMKPAK